MAFGLLCGIRVGTMPSVILLRVADLESSCGAMLDRFHIDIDRFILTRNPSLGGVSGLRHPRAVITWHFSLAKFHKEENIF